MTENLLLLFAFVVVVMAVMGIGGALLLAFIEPRWERLRVYLAEKHGW
jgi:hypothetical protein